MKYAYTIDVQAHGKSHYLTIFLDRVMFTGDHYRSHDYLNKQSAELKRFLNEVAKSPGVHGEHVHLEGSKLTVEVCAFNIGHTVEVLVKRLQRKFAPGEGRKRVSLEEVNATAKALNISRELKARNILVEAAKILPGSDPIRLASAIENLNLPPNEALTVLRGLADQFKGQNADPIRLVSGYKTILKLTA